MVEITNCINRMDKMFRINPLFFILQILSIL